MVCFTYTSLTTSSLQGAHQLTRTRAHTRILCVCVRMRACVRGRMNAWCVCFCGAYVCVCLRACSGVSYVRACVHACVCMRSVA